MTVVRDDVLEIDLSWSHYDGKYQNEHLHKPAGIALDRIRPLFRTWARRAGGSDMDLEGLLVSCYLQGFTDGYGADADRRAERGKGAGE
jgi:hypothetical protein